MNLTPRSLEIFLAYAKDACNWSGTPCLGANVPFSKEDRGNLTQLKRAGLVTTEKSDGLEWMTFTLEGRKLAAKHGVEIS
jgi:hypothetical protein